MPPPPPADASTSKVSSIALTSSEASSSVIDLSFSITSSTTALMCTLDAATLEQPGAARGLMKPVAAVAQRATGEVVAGEEVAQQGWGQEHWSGKVVEVERWGWGSVLL